MDIIAGKADGAENVVRVKAAVRNFAAETNLTVITEDGGFFTFDVYYAENPAVSTLNLTVQEPQPESMKKPAAVGYPQPTAPASEGRVLLREVGREKPATIKRMLSDIYRQNRTDVKGFRCRLCRDFCRGDCCDNQEQINKVSFHFTVVLKSIIADGWL